MKLDYIDSCRGIAILMVIMVHASQSVPDISKPLHLFASYGQMGVQLFFIASAFTLCLSWDTRRDGDFAWRNFYIRRFFRIAPMYYIGILFYLAISVLESVCGGNGFSAGRQYSIINIASNLVFLHGLYPPANNNIVPGGWSIGTEMIFYAVFPFVYSAIVRHRNSSLEAGFKLIILWSLSVHLLLLAVYLCTGKVTHNNSFLYFSFLVQSQAFLVGMIFYNWKKCKSLPNLSLALVIGAFMALTLLSAVIWGFGAESLFSVIPLVSATSFLSVMVLFEQYAFLNTPLLTRIGQLSYSMYLIHFVFAHSLARLVTPWLYDKFGGDLTFLVVFVGSCFGSFVVANITEKCIEKRFVSYGKRFTKSNVANNGNASVSATGGAPAARATNYPFV